MSNSVDSLPITGLCIVGQTCPYGYTMIDKCLDPPYAEADLWKDNIFAKKVKRFLCVTRVFPLSGGQLNNVLVDVAVLDERESAPAGYSTMATTQDTNEKAFKKRQLFVKLVPRSQAKDAITDIQFLCKQKRPPPGYTMISNDMNGLMVCLKVGPVPNDSSADNSSRTATIHSNVQTTSLPYPIPNVQTLSMQGRGNDESLTSSRVAPDRQISRIHPLSGVPFEINPKLQAGDNQWDSVAVNIRTRGEIYSSFEYEFHAEQQAINTCANFGRTNA